MNKQLCDIMKDALTPLNFADTVAGLVRTVVWEDVVDDRKVQKSFPVACDVSHTDCDQNTLKDLVPDSSKKTIMYFEDLAGANFIRRDRDSLVYRSSNIRLVCWINPPKMGKTDCFITPTIVGKVTQALTGIKFVNNAPFTHIKVNIIGQEPNNAGIFSKYSYDEKDLQYLMHPFEFFALKIQIEFKLNMNCLDDFTIDPPIDC